MASQRAFFPDPSRLRLLVWLRVRARWTVDRRKLRMQIFHEKRRLIAAGFLAENLEALVVLWDTRPVCPKCGAKIG